MRNLLFLLFLPFSMVLSQTDFDWETHSYMNDVKDLKHLENHIWAATTGGAYKFNIADSTFEKYTNVDGLASLDLTSVAIDGYGNVLFGAANGSISIINSQDLNWTTLSNLKGETITDLISNGDTLWVASETGLGVFLYNNSGYEFRDFYNSFPIVPSSTKKIVVFSDRIYFATNQGLLSASSNFIKTNLKSSENWTLYTTNDLLPNNDVRTLEIINDTLFIGTANGGVRLASDGWYGNLFGWGAGAITNFSQVNDTLYCFRYSDYYKYNNGIWTRFSGVENTIQSVTQDENNILWLAIRKNGLKQLNWDNSFLMDGPGSNFVGRIEKDKNGNLWFTSGKFKLPHGEGFYKYDFKQWTNYKFFGNKWTLKNNAVYVYEDIDENLWIGNWNGGLTALTDTGFFFIHPWTDSGEVQISTNSESNTFNLSPIGNKWNNCLSQSNELTDLMVIPFFTEDGNGNLYLVNYIAYDLNFITIIPRSGNGLDVDDCNNWIHLGSNIGLNTDESRISSIDFDDFGRMWLGTESKLLIVDFDESLSDPSDDTVYRLGVDDNLFSNTILSLKKDHDGVMWIGTAAGLNSYDGQNFYKHIGEIGPIENKINHIYVDKYNNKWFSTEGGLSILEGDKSPWDESAWKHYTTDNSGLAFNVVNSVFVDSDKGEAYIGTEGGLSIFRGAYAEIKPNLDNIDGGPNPFFVGNSYNNFTIKNMTVNSVVKILNINGKLVRILSEENGLVEGSRAVWDGRDLNNNLVSSGIYIYLVYSEEGVTGQGKLSVIRK